MTTQFTKPITTATQATDTPPTKRVKLPPKDKSHFEEFTERTSWQGERMLLRRCTSWKKHTDRTVQCNAVATNGYSICYNHGAHPKIGVRTPKGEAERIASLTKHGKLTNAEKEKVNKRTKQHRTLTKLAYALDQQTYKARGAQRAQYPAPTLSDVPELINTLQAIEAKP